MAFKHTGTAEIKTPRLALKRFEYNDIDGMLKNWISNPNIQHGYGEPVYETRESVKQLLDTWIPQYQSDAFYRWTIILVESNENIGQAAFCRVYTESRSAELEYCIGQEHWGNGYAPEALQAVIKYSFETPEFARLEAFHRIQNPASGRVLQKAGMKVVPAVKRFEVEGINPAGYLCYALAREEYLKIAT